MATATAAAQATLDLSGAPSGSRGPTVLSRADLARRGWTRGQVAAQLDARRWQLCGRAVVLHNGPLTERQRWLAALVNTGPRAVLTAFTAACALGLTGWERATAHVLAPVGVRVPRVAGISVRLHRSRTWPVPLAAGTRCHRLGSALVIAASSFDTGRPACGILAAAVQQRLISAAELRGCVTDATRTRHRAQLLAALADIAGGSQALSEIDFVRLCRRHGLPAPIRQLVRKDSSGRRRYLDATWRRSDGRLVVVEVDGALHLSPRRWWDDQHRQNELALAGALVLRFPSVIVRTDPAAVVGQLRRALDVP